MEFIRKRVIQSVFSALAFAGLPLVAQAGTINIILSDVDVSYLGGAAGGTGSVYDAIAHTGGNLNAAEADTLEAAVFEMDMAHVGTLMDSAGLDIYGDLKIDGVGATLPLGAFQPNVGSNGGGFGFDWFTSTGQNLRLGMNKIDLLLSNGVMFFTGTATLLSQNLPFGLAFDASQPIVFSYTATLPGVVGSPASGAMASGAMTISGTMAVPEPNTMAILGIGLSLAGCTFSRRRNHA